MTMVARPKGLERMFQEWNISLLDVSNPGVPCKNFGLRDDWVFWFGDVPIMFGQWS
jgi:hypothetical protein